MSKINVALLGFGTVGEGVYKTIQSHEKQLTALLGKKVEVVAVLIKNKDKKREIDERVLLTSNFDEILQLPQLDVIVEAIVDREPTFTYLQRAIKKGCHVITANKEMFAYHGKELLELANKHHVSVGFEATVAGGIPIIQTLQKLLNVNQVTKVEGILNGTSNFILTEMREKNQSFSDALRLAQQNGYAEADPTNDIKGNDAFFKLMIISQVIFGEQPKWDTVELNGIDTITSEQIQLANQLGLRYKHIASIQRTPGGYQASVRLALVTKSHPFYQIEGVDNAVHVKSDIVGGITLQGPGAGMFPTASAVIEDLVHCVNEPALQVKQKKEYINTPLEQVNGDNETYLLENISKPILEQVISDADQQTIYKVATNSVIIELDKRVVKQLDEQYPQLAFYPILGDLDVELLNEYREVGLPLS